MVLKVFFPQCCNRADSGLLVGRWIAGHDSAVVLTVIHYPFIPGQVKQYIQQMQAQSKVELSVLGSWSLPKEGQEGMESFLRDLSTIFPQERWLQISREMGKTGFTCQVLDRDPSGRAAQRESKKKDEEGDGEAAGEGEEKKEEEEEEEKVIFVHYEQRKVMLSQLHPIQNGVPDPQADPPSELRQMFQTVARSEPLFFMDKYDDGPLKSTHWQSEGREASIIVELLKQASVPLCLLISWLLSIWTWICNIRIFSLYPLRFLSSKLSTCVQLSYRTEHMRTLSSPKAAAGHTQFMRKANILVSFLVDVALGMLLISWLYRDNHITMLANTLVPAADHVAKELDELLQWLMGAPAGLKMNRALDQVLGRFFLYHIHLWISYIHLMSPFIEGILWYGGLSACFGLTFALSLLSDMVALLTFHIYCFYVYGASRNTTTKEKKQFVQAVLSEDLRPLVSLEALQREEVERSPAESRLLLLRPGPALHRDSAVHHPAVPAAHHSALLPGFHSVAAGGCAVPGRPPPQCGFHQLLPSVRFRPPHLPALQTSRRCKVQGAV
ncbi:phosphatidylinositol N-acetylglucosaminyltransferase subunit Q isoform X2 [Thunnus maccoyii]|uniref:phosphatidylinositol N-acetylglucosaminyltransferase subunit Q isoform X2 n=1 Tax=Thunnus maccoyii TaxID=8240 RepID=UPI001C4CD803|nr:phosphatidylinositol N-acetylglucosaminyltransferase subunit Q isoform X2 [Thunnus maccoyii]